MVRGGSAYFDGNEFPAWKMASSKAHSVHVDDRHFIESSVLERFQVSPGIGRESSDGVAAEVRSACAAIGDLVLDIPGNELSV